MSKRVYKFTKAQYGISNLHGKRLKLSTIDELNDPFDLCPIDTTDPRIEQAVNALGDHFRQTSAILCFSRNWDNLLLWSLWSAKKQLRLRISTIRAIDSEVTSTLRSRGLLT
jgi:hypothetical protein